MPNDLRALISKLRQLQQHARGTGKSALAGRKALYSLLVYALPSLLDAAERGLWAEEEVDLWEAELSAERCKIISRDRKHGSLLIERPDGQRQRVSGLRRIEPDE